MEFVLLIVEFILIVVKFILFVVEFVLAPIQIAAYRVAERLEPPVESSI